MFLYAGSSYLYLKNFKQADLFVSFHLAKSIHLFFMLMK